MMRRTLKFLSMSLLLVLTLQAYHAGAQDDMTGSANGLADNCALTNTLSIQNILSWTIYFNSNEFQSEEPPTLAEAADSIIKNYGLDASHIYTPLWVGNQWILRVLPNSTSTDQNTSYIFANENDVLLLQSNATSNQLLNFIKDVIASVPIDEIPGQSLATYETDTLLYTLPQSWQPTESEDNMWLQYALTDTPDAQILLTLLQYTDNCQRMNLGRARRDITNNISGYNALWHQQRNIGDKTWSIDSYRLTTEDNQKLDGRLYLHYLGDTVLAIKIQIPSGPSASTAFRQLTSHIALIMTR